MEWKVLTIEKTQIYLVICSLIRTFAADYEKSRNEKNRNMENPFKFGTIVEAEYFTDKRTRGQILFHIQRMQKSHLSAKKIKAWHKRSRFSYNIANVIYSSPPKAPRSIDLGVSNTSPVTASTQTVTGTSEPPPNT